MNVAAGLAWQADALCASSPVDLWNSDDNQHAEGRRVCLRCPAMVPCREYAIATPGCLGMWGGMSERERRRIRRFRSLTGDQHGRSIPAT